RHDQYAKYDQHPKHDRCSKRNECDEPLTLCHRARRTEIFAFAHRPSFFKDRIMNAVFAGVVEKYRHHSLKFAAAVPLACCCLLSTGLAQARDACYYERRGEQWDAFGDWDMAIANYSQAIALDSCYEAAYNNRGFDWYKKKDYDRALADYNRALALCPNDG